MSRIRFPSEADATRDRLYLAVKCLVYSGNFRSHVASTGDGRGCNVPQLHQTLFEDFTLAFLGETQYTAKQPYTAGLVLCVTC
ncbi:hypothetical protein E2C01_045159 [Portunus trituberculatus]|uniref:Uncharacterized protein n=1 Tax=Portunus trituberculatus TaxID=210409 RepID=A0A5B7G4A6_PORTR|nr:hypothetical protein [Portunus trituberculatus]